ncbi:MAG TPA: hypothetical protein VF203_02275 [Burkholderiales bacterium]
MKRLLAGALLAAADLCGACEPALEGAPLARIDSPRYVLAFRTEPARVAVGEHFALLVAACGKDNGEPPSELRVDAHMPAHRHGMNYAASVEPLAPGRWRAEGLLFHMPGDWEFLFDLRGAGPTERLSYPYRLE